MINGVPNPRDLGIKTGHSQEVLSKVFEAMPAFEQHYSHIHVSGVPDSSINSYMSTLWRMGYIDRVDKGVYRKRTSPADPRLSRMEKIKARRKQESITAATATEKLAAIERHAAEIKRLSAELCADYENYEKLEKLIKTFTGEVK